jgi:aspartate/methionine/tyrosine aminotransferase
MTSRFEAPYVHWANTRAPARFDLAASNVLSCDISDLRGARDAIDLAGDNAEGYAPLVDAIGARYGVPAAGVTTAHGATGANFLVCAALLEPGDEVIVERPGYDALLGAPRLLGARTARFERDFATGFELDPERVRRALTPRTRLIVLTSPQNPTGVASGTDALDALGRIAEAHGAHVLVDEVYRDAVAAPAPHQQGVVRTTASLGDVFISTSSLTKSYGLSGLRCGWVLSSPAIAERLRHVRGVVGGSSSIVTDRLATLAFGQIDRLIARSRLLLDANGALIRAFLRSRPELEWIDPGGGTVVFPRIRNVADADTFVDRLFAAYDTAVVPGRFFEAPAHFRIGFGGTTDALRSGLQAIGAALDARDW